MENMKRGHTGNLLVIDIILKCMFQAVEGFSELMCLS